MISGKLLMYSGLGLFLLGVLLSYSPGLLGWFGKLPGDIRIERERSMVFFPLVSMILLSLVVTVVLNLLSRR